MIFKNTIFFLLLVARSTQVSAGTCSAAVTCWGTSTCSCAAASSSGVISGVIALNPYPNSATCTWLITSSSTNQIILRFTTLVTELDYDYLYVETCTSPSSCDEWDPSADTDASEAPMAIIVNSSELRAAGFDLREVLPLQLEAAVRGVRRTRGATLKQIHDMGTRRYVLSVDNDNEFRSRCE